MAGPNGRKPDETKSLPGSFEERRNRISEALRDAAILPAGDLWVTDTFDASVVVVVYAERSVEDGGGYESRYFQVEISAESDDGFEFGAVKEVEIEYTERLVDAKAAAGSERRKTRADFRLKSLTTIEDAVGGWAFAGTFSVFNYEDHSKDIVRAGATKDSTAVHLPKILDHHGKTVGQATKAVEENGGLYVEGRIYPTRDGEDLVKLMQPIETDLGPHAPVEQGSIGFSPMEGGAKRRQGGGWEYTKLWIWEVSPVTFGDNDATRVGLKSLADVNAMPTADLLAYAGEVVRLAVDGADGAKALYRRRLDDDRPLTDAQWKAVDALEIETAEVLLDLVTLKGRAGKVASNAHLRHMRAIIDGLADLIHGRAETPSQLAPAADEGDDSGKDGKEGAARAAPGGEHARSKDLRDWETELFLTDLGIEVDTPVEV